MATESSDQLEREERAWREARSFTDICELTALYVEGHSSFCPSHGGLICPETAEISDYLAALNPGGFLTICSQPGDSDQRAFVQGYAPESIARVLARVTLYTDLYVIVVPPTEFGGYHIPVTLDGLQPFSWAGFSSFGYLDDLEEVCDLNVMNELVSAWFIAAIDLRWGRKLTLWQSLCGALGRYSEIPAAGLGLESDFVGPVYEGDEEIERRLARLRKYGERPPEED